jgi:hypothetical protein
MQGPNGPNADFEASSRVTKADVPLLVGFGVLKVAVGLIVVVRS